MIEGLLVWRLWHRSVFAWFVLVVDVVLMLSLFVLMGMPSDAGSIAALSLGLAMTVILFAPMLPRFVWSYRDTAVAG